MIEEKNELHRTYYLLIMLILAVTLPWPKLLPSLYNNIKAYLAYTSHKFVIS